MSACERSRVKVDVTCHQFWPLADAAFDRLPIPSPETDSSRSHRHPDQLRRCERYRQNPSPNAVKF